MWIVAERGLIERLRPYFAGQIRKRTNSRGWKGGASGFLWLTWHGAIVRCAMGKSKFDV
jgi:hypothetical protein